MILIKNLKKHFLLICADIINDDFIILHSNFSHFFTEFIADSCEWFSTRIILFSISIQLILSICLSIQLFLLQHFWCVLLEHISKMMHWSCLNYFWKSFCWESLFEVSMLLNKNSFWWNVLLNHSVDNVFCLVVSLSCHY